MAWGDVGGLLQDSCYTTKEPHLQGEMGLLEDSIGVQIEATEGNWEYFGSGVVGRWFEMQLEWEYRKLVFGLLKFGEFFIELLIVIKQCGGLMPPKRCPCPNPWNL